MSVAEKKVRFTVSLLLALCLLPIVTKTHFPTGSQKPGAAKKTALFAHAVESYVVSAFTIGKRTNFSSFDGFSSESILRQILFDCTRQSSLFLSQSDLGFRHRVKPAALPIRAPPLPS
jgi:hypothetical protein